MNFEHCIVGNRIVNKNNMPYWLTNYNWTTDWLRDWAIQVDAANEY